MLCRELAAHKIDIEKINGRNLTIDVFNEAGQKVISYKVYRAWVSEFTAQTDLLLSVTDGGAIRLTVNGKDLGIPGTPGQPWSEPFSFGTSDGATPSAGT